MIIVAGALLAIPLILPMRRDLIHRPVRRSLQILDCRGSALREILSDQRFISHYCTLDSISPYLIMATLASEDRRFFAHNGIDYLAVVRSAMQNVISRRVVSGASTITQQLARGLLGSKSRDIFSKSREAIFALFLELKLHKLEILELYLNSAPYGNLTYGIEAAAQLYFRKPARDLTCDESALLAVLPRAPSYYNPYYYPERTAAAQKKLLQQMHRAGYIDSTSLASTIDQPLQIIPRERNFKAPHFCEYVLTQLDYLGNDISRIGTTLDMEIQTSVEKIIDNNLRRLEKANVTNAAVIVLELNDFELRAYVGSADFFEPACGAVDGAQSLRQPGSTIKPFTYALALQNQISPAELIPDLPTYAATPGGDYRPRNYDEKFHGMVRLRTALACSYNIPAVRILERIGIDELWRCLRRSGFNSLSQPPVHYGLGLTLGNGEVKLFELTRAFGIFASHGQYRPVNFVRSINGETVLPNRKRVPVFKPAVAYIIGDILDDNNARSPAFGEFSPLTMPFFCPVKTGTSKDYRDNWCIGYTSHYLVGVWVGNFDGSPMNQVSGITGAAPIFRDIMLYLHRNLNPVRPAMPDSTVTANICALSGRRPGHDCENIIRELFIKGNEPEENCNHRQAEIEHQRATELQYAQTFHYAREFSIVFPDNGDIYRIDPILRYEYQKLRMQVATTLDIADVTWFVDDQKLATVRYPYSYHWQLAPGEHVITALATTKDGMEIPADPVRILVLE